VVDIAILDHEDVEEEEDEYASEDPLDISVTREEIETIAGEDTEATLGEDADPLVNGDGADPSAD